MPSTLPSQADTTAAGDLTVRRRMPAWAMSALLHTLGIILLVLTLRFSPQGVVPEPDRAVGVALSRQQDGKKEYFDEAAEQSQFAASEAEASATASASPLPEMSELPMDLSGVLPASEELTATGTASDFLPSADELTQGTQPGKSFGGQASTQVFGLTGQGSKFVYVFDRSGSMSGYGGRPLRSAKSELIASLDDLERTHQFQIIFYNEEPRIFTTDGRTPRLVWGDDQGKTLAQRFVRSIIASGGTRHMMPLTMALKMRPDVIFFLTDAEEPQLSSDELSQIRRLNNGTQIHAIEFGFGGKSSDDNFLKKLARQNGGAYAYVDISKLPE